MRDITKIIKKLPTGFQEEADAMSEQKLRDCIVQSERNLKEAIEGMEENEKFQALKAQYQEAMHPLKDVKSSQKAKIAYCLHCLEARGK